MSSEDSSGEESGEESGSGCDELGDDDPWVAACEEMDETMSMRAEPEFDDDDSD